MWRNGRQRWQRLIRNEIIHYLKRKAASLMAQQQSIRLPVREMRVQSLGREDPLEEGMATHSGILAWRTPWTEEPSRLQSRGS